MLSAEVSQLQNLVEQQGCQADFDSWSRIKTALAELGTTPNSRYATALEVFNKWFTEHRGASHDTGDFYDWVKERLNAEKPHCA